MGPSYYINNMAGLVPAEIKLGMLLHLRNMLENSYISGGMILEGLEEIPLLLAKFTKHQNFLFQVNLGTCVLQPDYVNMCTYIVFLFSSLHSITVLLFVPET